MHFHRSCFTCEKCDKPLSGVPFCIHPKSNKACCKPCWHAEFGIQCYCCKKPVLPDGAGDARFVQPRPGFVFHKGCYKCQDCGHDFDEEDIDGAFEFNGKFYCHTDGRRRSSGILF